MEYVKEERVIEMQSSIKYVVFGNVALNSGKAKPKTLRLHAISKATNECHECSGVNIRK